MSAALPTEPPPLRLSTKLSYGTGSLAIGASFYALSGSVLQYYLNQVVRLPALLVGTALALSLIVDALIDPLVGQWSDNFRSRWGRRHPFMYVGAFLAALSFYFLWHAPAALSGNALLVYMLVVLIAVRLSGSLYEIPSNALMPELAPDYDQRTVLSSFRFFFFVVGAAALSVLLNAVFLRKDASHPLGLLNREGYAQFAVVGASVMFVAIIISCLGTQSRVAHLHSPPKRPMSLAVTWREIRATLSNPSLIVLLASGLFGGVAAGMRGGLDNYLYTHFWMLKPQQLGLLIPLGLLGSVVSVFVAPVLSRRLGKKMTMVTLFTGSTISSLAPIALKLVGLMPPDGSPWVMVILGIDAVVVAALAISGFIIILSMVADVVEDNAVKTGHRAEGLLFATNGLLPKFTAGIGAFLAGALVSAVHFPTHAAQGTVPAALMRHLVLLFLPGYAILVALSILVLIFYRIDRESHERNLEQLRQAAALADAALTTEAESGVTPLSRTV
jgi:GPH family glycoside/pentoside/hexuronide:cation symporter